MVIDKFTSWVKFNEELNKKIKKKSFYHFLLPGLLNEIVESYVTSVYISFSRWTEQYFYDLLTLSSSKLNWPYSLLVPLPFVRIPHPLIIIVPVLKKKIKASVVYKITKKQFSGTCMKIIK